MARTARPWYTADKRCYRAYVRGRRVPLVKGDENSANEKLAHKKLSQILKGARNDAAPGQQTVASVIDRYLTLHQQKYSERAFEAAKR